MSNQVTSPRSGRGRAVSILLPVLLLTVTGGTARAQVMGANVGGVIADQSGARLPGVTVTVKNNLNGATHVLVTAEQGNYRAVSLPPAPYTITAELAGFAPARRDVTLNVGTDATVDFTLSVANVTESVTVAGNVPVIEVTKSALSSVVLSDQVASLPTLGRNFMELAQILPGSGPDNSQVQYFNPTKFGGVADQRNGFTTIIDGGGIDDAIWGSTVMNVSQDAVQEFKVFRNQFDAEYGNALSSVVAVVTKAGSNRLSGSGFYFGRDRKLNATDFFASEKPPFSQQRYGESLGGPIAQNRTHFFNAYEYSKVNTSRIIALPAVNPFAARENGVFPSGSSDHMFDTKFDHRLNDAHSFIASYQYDNLKLQRTQSVSSDSAQIDEYSRAHSLVVEENWIASQNIVNSFRAHYLDQNVGNTPHSFDVAINRPSVSTGQFFISPQYFPRTLTSLYDTAFISLTSHDIKFGGELAFASTNFESHFFEHGQFDFSTDAPFDPNNSATWPYALTIQKPGLLNYKSKQVALFAQDTWRVRNRVRLNLGVRYDLDTNLRMNDFYNSIIANPRYAGITNFISSNRGNDFSAVQPRAGFTWDMRGNGTLVVRGGLGRYNTRNRPWFQVYSQSTLLGNAVRIEDPAQLRFFPNITAVLGGKSLDAYAAAGGSSSPFLISDSYVLPYSINGTIGMGWQLNASTSVDVDYVHDYGTKQLGGTDRNLPASGPISASNPRPVPNFGLVNVMENYTKSWYDALEVQLRTHVRAIDNLQVSYSLSRSYRDGVYFFATLRGTQRTPQEEGYNDTDQRHNLTFAAATTLPAKFQISAILKLVSGSPMRVQAGYDLDGDGSIQGDRPRGLPPVVGRNQVSDSLRLINDIRTQVGLSAIDASLLQLDPFISLDARLTKIIEVGATRRFEVFLEGYNLTNHENFQPFTINANINSASFLIRNSARPPRQIQWGARYSF